jgi:hypothetical protein
MTVAIRAVTSRRRPRREMATSPASPEEASRPVEATVAAMASANTVPPQVGVLPQETEAASAPGSRSSATPRPMIRSWRVTSTTVRGIRRRIRRSDGPSTLTTATAAMMPTAMTSSIGSDPSAGQKAPR